VTTLFLCPSKKEGGDMLTEKEMQTVRTSDKICLDEVLYGHLKLEDLEAYFKRELKENLLEQGWELPEGLINPDDDNAPVPGYLKEKPDPDTRSRYDGIYDGGELIEEPHYGSSLYWQWQAIKHGRLNYLKVYTYSGEEIKIPRGMYGKLLVNIYDFLLGNVKNPIRHKGYELFQIRREELDLDDDLEGLAFATIYLF
jgi:hypothetical protein